jgi:hypothetical protein
MKGFALVLVSVILALALGSSPTPDDSEQCLSCQEQVAQLDSIWSNATTVAEMLTNLEAECKDKYKLVKRKICDKIAEVAVTIPPQIFEGMEGLAWDIPIATCATIHECTTNCCSVDSIEQVHLSLEHKDRSMMGVSWVTLNSQDSLVQYSITNNFETEGDTSNVVEVTGAVNTYTQAGWIGTIHKAMMTNLKPATTYYYRVGSGGLWSDVFEFKTFDPAQKTINFAVVADMGYGPNSDDTVARLQEKVEKGEIDVILHNGDIGYADGYMVHWDAFFNKIQPIATRVPYMVTPGNHEFWYNFAAYKARFYMPSNSGNGEEQDGSGDNMWYAWDYGNVHFAAMNSETAVDTQNFHKNMLEYFAADLQTVDRAVTPFVVAHFHRPMYVLCSMLFLPSFLFLFVMSLSLSLSSCLPACIL